MLNAQQMAAVTYIKGPLLVLAGAGSGKTRVITHKIAYLIEKCSYSPNSICALTFTNKVAQEMKERIIKVLPRSLRRGLQISTFHTLGLKIIRSHLALCGLRTGFSIFDSEDCLRVLQNLLPASKATDRECLGQIQLQISRWKNALFSQDSSPLEMNAIEEIYSRYQRSLQAYNAIDFDDLICLPVKLLSQNEEIKEKWQKKIRYLLVDEYQDTNACQYTLVQLLTGIEASFTVVGDDHQSIYEWRGARPENLVQLSLDYPQLKLIKLEQNYRSMGRILTVANCLINNNSHLFPKKLWSNLGPGDLLRVLVCKDEVDEAEQVVADLIHYKLRRGNDYGDYAILYRGNHQSRVFEKILRNHGIAYSLSGGQSWFARTEIKDILAYLKLLSNPEDDPAFLRIINIPKRGIGEASLEILAKYAQKRGKSLFHCADDLALTEYLTEKVRLALQQFKHWFIGIRERLQGEAITERLREMIDESRYENYVYEQSEAPAKAEKRMANVWELIDWVGKLQEKTPDLSLGDLINKLILMDILDKANDSDRGAVKLMTLHASKGLEFPHVYLVGLEEELLPHRSSIEEDRIEEERRLTYVGITRAEKSLCFTLARKRRRGGELHDSQPSRFLQELPQDCLEWFGKNQEGNEAQSKALATSHLLGLKKMLS